MANNDSTDQVAQEIRQIGFIRWHSRTLMRAHLHLITCILGVVVIGVGFEAFSDPQAWWEWLRRYGTMGFGALLVMFGWTHYLVSMQRAQRRADRANCPKCGVYGSFDVKMHGETPADDDESHIDQAAGWIRVVCRRCGEQWNI